VSWCRKAAASCCLCLVMLAETCWLAALIQNPVLYVAAALVGCCPFVLLLDALWGVKEGVLPMPESSSPSPPPPPPKAPPAATLRDQIAACALQGLLAEGEAYSSYLSVAREAYTLADAMLQVRQEPARDLNQPLPRTKSWSQEIRARKRAERERDPRTGPNLPALTPSGAGTEEEGE